MSQQTMSYQQTYKSSSSSSGSSVPVISSSATSSTISTRDKQPLMNPRTTIITREKYGGGSLRHSTGGLSGGMSFSQSYQSGTFSSLSGTGVATIKEGREKEKKEMQGLNERLAGYIEKVRFLEARIKMLEEQLSHCQGVAAFDLQPIRDMYEVELKQARTIINSISAEKAGMDAKLVGLQDEVDRQIGIIAVYEKQKLDYVSKINQLTTQVGDYEGELTTLRLRITHAEQENDKLRDLLVVCQNDIKKLRTDLDAETCAHIEASNRAQTFEEECEFLRVLLDKIPKQEQQTSKIQGMDVRAWWESQLSKCVRDLNAEYQSVVDTMRQDMEIRMSAQLRQLQSGAVKENLESTHLKEEVTRIKAMLSERNTALSEATARIAHLETELNDICRQLSDTKMELDAEKIKYTEEITSLRIELERCVHEIQLMMDAKLSMELEIACYRQLLEGEENRTGLKQIVEQAIGVQSSGSQQLASFVEQSSFGQSEGKVTVQRTSTGIIGFVSSAADGSVIDVCNNSSGVNAKSQSMKGWRIVKTMDNGNKIEFKFGDDVVLDSGVTYKIYSKGAAHGKTLGRHECSADFYSWEMGSCKVVLYDDSGNEKGTLTSKLVQAKFK